MKTQFRWELAVAVAAWAMFVVSFFLPAFDQMPGWKAAILQSLFWPQAVQGQWLAIHYLLLTFANLLMLASPVLLAWAGQNARYLYSLLGLSFGVVVLVWSFVVLIAYKNATDLRAGCFLWASSFVLLFLASLFRRIFAASSSQAA